MKKKSISLAFWIIAALLGCILTLKGCLVDDESDNKEKLPEISIRTTTTIPPKNETPQNSSTQSTTEIIINEYTPTTTGGITDDSSFSRLEQ